MTIDSIVNGNGQLKHPYYKDDMRDQVMEVSANGDFEWLIIEYNKENASFLRRARVKKTIAPSCVDFYKENSN